VYDLAGHCLLATAPAEYKAGKNNVALDVSSLSQGFYFVEVTVNGHSNTQKIVVNR
jgi:YbbR domain-containing protein